MAQRAISLISSITLAMALGALITPVDAQVKPPEYADKNTMVFECAEVSDLRVPGIRPVTAFVECRRSTVTGGVLCFIQNPPDNRATAALYRCAAE